MDFSQITSMSEADVIKNFGRVGANIDELFRRVVVTIMPVVDRMTAAEAQQAEQARGIEASVKSMTVLEERLSASVNPIIQQWDDVKNKVQQYELELGKNTEAHGMFKHLIDELDVSMANLRIHVDKTAAEANGQMGALLATVQNAGPRLEGSGGGGHKGPLVTNRIFDNLARLSGNEDHKVIDDWYDEVERNFELLLPGSSAVMIWALKQDDKITYTLMSHEANAHFMLKVSRELFAVMMNRTEDKAKSHVKVLTPQDGLEAWRSVRNALNRRDGQRLQAEFENLTTHMKPIAITELKTLNTLLAKWEKELGDFEAIDREYNVGAFQKR